MSKVDGVLAAFTSYLGVSGTTSSTRDGILYQESRHQLTDIADGQSNTLLLGERPPSSDFHLGWWYAGNGVDGTGTADMHMGMAERTPWGIGFGDCPSGGPFPFGPGSLQDDCSILHYWSLHSGGANFLFCDGSVHFIPYAAAPIMPALATRAGREAVSIDF
jgi:prepilin-type processing-associated H-X9-DG protein